MNEENSREERETEIDLLALLKAIWAHILIILPVTIACALVGFVLAYAVIPPTYSASVKMYVNNKTSSTQGISTSDISTSKSLVTTYIEILKTRTVLDRVAERTNGKYTEGQIAKMISAASVNSTELFQVTVTCGDPEEAAMIANLIAEELPAGIESVVDESNVKTAESAVVPTSKTGPSVTKYTVIGGLIGLVIMCAIYIIRELTDDRIHDIKYLQDNYNIPVLTSVPDLMQK